MAVRWGPVRLSQTRPIPRSPDGDKNFNEKGKYQVLLLQKRQQPKLEVEKVLSLPILLFFVPFLPGFSIVALHLTNTQSFATISFK